MSDQMIWVELGRRMGYADYFPWENTEQLHEYLLKSTNISLDRLRRNPGGVYYAEREFQKYLEGGFNTPSGKVEIYSETMAQLGYDPIPTFHEPAESLVSRPDLAEKYPLLLITGARTRPFQHSRDRNIPSLRQLVPEPLIEINPQAAKNLGVADRDLVKVESLRGSIKLKARLTEDIHPRVVSIQHGWSKANANYLTDDESRDPVSGFPGFRSVLCRVEKAK
ncbi:Acetylene hydratase [subsurface metagenome]